MSRDYWCKICDGYMPSSTLHRCPPKFYCRIDDKYKTDKDWSDIYATDPETAAEKWAERHDCGNEYWILTQGDNCEAVIEVRDSGGAITRWSIRAESVPHYYAEQIEAG